jgi:hypothetical protein
MTFFKNPLTSILSDSISRLLELDLDKLLSYYQTWGPSARTCINLVRCTLTVEEHEQNASEAAATFASNPQDLFRLVSGFNSSNVSHVLFAVLPLPGSRGEIRAEIPTNHLNGILARAVAMFDATQQSMFFSQISSHPWTTSSAGWMFEKFVHIRLTLHSASSLECVSANAPTLTMPVCRYTYPLNGKTSLQKVNKFKLPFYMRRTSTSFTSIDAIICIESDIFLVQATLTSQHDVKVSGLDAIFDNLPVKFRQHRNWRLVFITPTEECAQGLRNQSTSLPPRWEGILDFYSCTFMVGQGKLTSTEMQVLAELIVSSVLRIYFCL